MSPGGRMRYSRRNRPELPPSSVTVTMAVRSAMGCCGRRLPRSAMCCFSPRSTVERPVPPPSATTRTDGDRRSTAFFMGECRKSAGRTVALRVEQLGKARIFLQECEILVVASVIAVFRTQLDGDLEVEHRRIGFAGQAVESRHGVDDVIGLRRSLAGAIEVLPRFVPAAQVNQRHALGIVVFRGLRRGRRQARNALLADAQVNPGAIT